MSELSSLSNRSKILLILWSLFLAAGFFCWGIIFSKLSTDAEITTPTITISEGISRASTDTPTNLGDGGDYLCLD